MDPVMALSGTLFFFLLAFILFIFAVFLLSFFVKRSFPAFQPPVSVVIPAYNEEKGMAACLDSVFASGYKGKLEVIAVDDGSTDATAAIVGKYKAVRLLRQAHLGKPAALTLGAKKARHQFIVALDADTVIEKGCIAGLVRPLADSRIGAATGVTKVLNMGSLLGMFQQIEYSYNSLIKSSFSSVFNNGIWFFGVLACYRKEALEKVGYFKPDTLTEDMDIALELKLAGYRTYNTKDAVCHTLVPETISAFYRQRSRWWIGTLQALAKNRRLFSLTASPSIIFLFVNQLWWTFYSFLSLPLILYQVAYWLPYNSGSVSSLSGYLFRWFSLAGPVYVLYKIPEWGVSFYSIFGVLAGVVSSIMIAESLRRFRDRIWIGSAIAIFFYFPYTIGLNLVTFISCLTSKRLKSKFFIKQ